MMNTHPEPPDMPTREVEVPTVPIQQVLDSIFGVADEQKRAAVVAVAADVAASKTLSPKRLLKLFRVLYQAATGTVPPSFTVGEYAEDWARLNPMFKSGSTAEGQRMMVCHLRNWLEKEGVLETRLLDDFKPRDVRRFAHYLMNDAKHSALGANDRLATLSNMLNRAVEDGLADTNVARGIKVYDPEAIRASEALKKQPFTRKHVEQMIELGIQEGCNPEMTVASLVALDLGARKGDVFGLHRQFYKPESGDAVYFIRKLRKYHRVILFPSTLRLLEEYCTHHLLNKDAMAPLFPTFLVPNGPKVADRTFLIASANLSLFYWKYLITVKVRKEGLLKNLNEAQIMPDGTDERPLFAYSFHSHRATVSTAMKLAGVPEPVVMARLCHHSLRANLMYDRFSVQNVCLTVFKRLGLDQHVDASLTEPSVIRMHEIFELQDRATRKLRGMRGQLDLHDGTTPYGAKTARACMLPPIVVPERLRWTKSRPMKPKRPQRRAVVPSNPTASPQASVSAEATHTGGDVS